MIYLECILEIYDLIGEFIYLCIHRVYMATLYWRHKKGGRWTWTRANIVHQEWTADELTVYIDGIPGKEEEE